VNSDAGSVTAIGVDASDKLAEVEVGADPVRIARAGDSLFVTVRGSGEVVVLNDGNGQLSEAGRIAVGPDPFGIVANEQGTRVYVAVGMSGSVLEIDALTFEVLNRFDGIPGQPRWLALHPSGKALYVGSAFGGTWSHVDLETGALETHTPPERFRASFDHERGEANERVIMTPRITGDLAVSPDGRTIAVPVLYVDHFTSVDNEEGEIGETGGYSSGPGVGRTNPVVLMVESDRGGEPRPEGQRTLFAQGARSIVNNGSLDQQNVRSYLSSLTFSPDGLMLLASMEGSEAIVAMPMNIGDNRNGISARGGRADFDIDFEPGFEQDAGFEFQAAYTVATDAGPRGLVFTSRDAAMVDSWLDRSVAKVPFEELHEAVGTRVVNNNLFQGEDLGLSIGSAVISADLTVDASVDQGRKLFYSATNGSMAAHSGGISCATCHMDGRNDGLSWTFAEGDRQTPSLAGNVTATEPVTWTKDFEGEPISVDLEVRLTSGTRMGGSGAGMQQSFSVQDYIDFTPYPQTVAELDAGAIERGREIFNGSAQCSSCHNGAQFTDSQPYAMAGLDAVRTPTLRGVAATAPYLHDGRAADLAELVAIAEREGMGKTEHLSADEKADLVTYLEAF